VLEREAQIEAAMELCYSPFDLAEAMRRSVDDPPATLLVLPNGWVKVAAVLPHICADLRKATLAQAWQAYRDAWRDPEVIAAARSAVEDESKHAQANRWRMLLWSVSEPMEAR
jgi:cation transport regulator ChaB